MHVSEKTYTEMKKLLKLFLLQFISKYFLESIIFCKTSGADFIAPFHLYKTPSPKPNSVFFITVSKLKKLLLK